LAHPPSNFSSRSPLDDSYTLHAGRVLRVSTAIQRSALALQSRHPGMAWCGSRAGAVSSDRDPRLHRPADTP